MRDNGSCRNIGLHQVSLSQNRLLAPLNQILGLRENASFWAGSFDTAKATNDVRRCSSIVVRLLLLGSWLAALGNPRKPCVCFRPFIGQRLEASVRGDLIVRVRLSALRMFFDFVKARTTHQE